MNLRTLLMALATLFAGFAAYGSLVPLQLREISVSHAVAMFMETRLVPVWRASRTDLLTNVLLFVPIGFFLLGAIAPRSRRAAAIAAVPVVAASVALSVAIEFGQVFVVGRTPSWNDVLAHSLGGATGAALWLAAGGALIGWFAPLLRSSTPADRALRLLGAYTAIWLLLGVVPFDYTVRPQEIAEKFRAGRLVLQPFAPGTSVADVVGALLMAVPVGVFCALAARHFRVAAPRLVALAAGIAAAALVECVQVLAVSRTADITDLIAASAGIVAGVQIGSRRADVLEAGRIRLWPLAALAGWLVVLLTRHWAPFDFVVDGAFITSRVPLMFRVPFLSYYWGNPINAFVEVVTKVLLALPVGMLLQLVWLPRSRRGQMLQLLAVGIASAALFLAIEVGQLMLPTRVPDQTDVYIGTAGALLGMLLTRLVSRGLGDAALDNGNAESAENRRGSAGWRRRSRHDGTRSSGDMSQ